METLHLNSTATAVAGGGHVDWHAKLATLVRTSSYGTNKYGDNNFDSPLRAFVVLFEQMVINNWPIVMEGCFAAHGPMVSVAYFLSFHITCVLVVSNVVVAFTIDAFDQQSSLM